MPQLAALEPWGAAVRIVVILLVASLGYVLLRFTISLSVDQVLERRRGDSSPGGVPQLELERRVRTLGRLGVRIGAAVILVIATLMILGELGIDVGPALAGLGVVGIAVGFGAQSLVRDWFAGIFIVLENQYSQGDVVRVAGVEGVVEDFSLRRTTLRDLDGTTHNVPNGQITVASNLTRLWGTLRVDVHVADEADVARAVEVLADVARELKVDLEWTTKLIAAPRVIHGADRAVVLEAHARLTDQDAVRGELKRRAAVALKAAGIRAPRR